MDFSKVGKSFRKCLPECCSVNITMFISSFSPPIFPLLCVIYILGHRPHMDTTRRSAKTRKCAFVWKNIWHLGKWMRQLSDRIYQYTLRPDCKSTESSANLCLSRQILSYFCHHFILLSFVALGSTLVSSFSLPSSVKCTLLKMIFMHLHHNENPIR